MSEHIVTAFTEELDALAADLLRMGGLVESMISDACRSVMTSNHDLALDVIERDPQVDELEAGVERQIVSLIARRQPMAHDLRSCLSALKVSGELERIGDLSKNIAKRARELDREAGHSMRRGIERMGKSVSRQLQLVLDAYSSGSSALAIEVWEGDDDVDQLYNSLFREMLTYMIEDPRMISTGAHMLFMAKNLERIGDHCTNVAEFVHFQATGKYLVSQERPRAPQFDPTRPTEPSQ